MLPRQPQAALAPNAVAGAQGVCISESVSEADLKVGVGTVAGERVGGPAGGEDGGWVARRGGGRVVGEVGDVGVKERNQGGCEGGLRVSIRGVHDAGICAGSVQVGQMDGGGPVEVEEQCRLRLSGRADGRQQERFLVPVRAWWLRAHVGWIEEVDEASSEHGQRARSRA